MLTGLISRTRFAISARPAADLSITDVRIRHARLIVAALGIAACAGILWLARDYTFFYDEWTFIITAPAWRVADYFAPTNEHPAVLFRPIYSFLLHTVGLRSYLPYLGVLLAGHFANAVLLFEVVRRRAGDLIGLAAALLLLLIGAGWDDLLWAFQLAWQLSVACGLGMLLLLQSASTRRRMAGASLLLLCSLAFSGTGLVFAIAGGVQLLLTPQRRTDLAWFVAPAASVVVWYALFGRFAGHPTPGPTPYNLVLLPAYVAWGLSQSAAALIGELGGIGLAVLAACTAAVAWRWRRRGADPFALGVAAALVGFYAIAGAARAQLGVTEAGSSRYIYIGAVLWLILLGDAARGLPWHGTWRPALVACLFLAVFNSGVLLFEFATARNVVMQRQVADYYALAAERTDPCLDPDGRVDPLVMPAETRPAAYYRAIDMFGDPIGDARLLDRPSYEAGVRNLRRPNC